MSSTSPWVFIGAAAIGVVSAACMFIVEHYKQERRRHAMAQSLVQLNQQMSVVKRELDQLRALQKSRNTSRKKRSNHSSALSTTTSDDYSSAIDPDSSDLEFFDLSDEEVIKSNVTITFEALLNEIDFILEETSLKSVNGALEQLNELRIDHPENSEILWRIGKAHHKIVEAVKDPETKRLNADKGVEACTTALNFNSKCFEAHKWLAILIGARSELQPLKERISDGYLFKEHVDAAIVLDPTDASLHHMLGRFAYEVASLKWYERKAATAFFAEPPTATYEEALSHFNEAEKLSKHEWKENRLLLAKCLIAMGDYSGAAVWLSKADSITGNDVDEKIDTEVKSLLLKYNSYR